MTFIEEAINNNIEDLVDVENRHVEPTDNAATELVVAWTEDNPHEFTEMLFCESMEAEYQQFYVDMAKAFAGKISGDEFVAKYGHCFQTAKREIIDDLESKIWNTAVDVFNIPPVDMYEYNGVRREDF